MHEQSFQDIVPPTLLKNLYLLKKNGNKTAHSASPITQQESFAALRILFDFSLWVVRLYCTRQTPVVMFDETLLVEGNTPLRKRKEVESLQQQYEDTRQQLDRANKALETNEFIASVKYPRIYRSCGVAIDVF